MPPNDGRNRCDPGAARALIVGATCALATRTHALPAQEEELKALRNELQYY